MDATITKHLRTVVEQAPPGPWMGVVGAATTQIFARYGSFVLGADVSRLPAHRYACTFDPVLVTAMLDVIDAADGCLVPGFADLTHEQAVARTDALVDALQGFSEAAGHYGDEWEDPDR